MEAIRVVIVDDHPLYRDGVRTALDAAADIAVVAAVGTAAQALAACRDACPDVVLLDINLPDASGIQVATELAAGCPATGIIALTAYEEAAYMIALAEAGAHGYLLKTATDAEIIRAVRAVAGGEMVFAPAVTQALLRHASAGSARPDFGLSERELAVLGQAALGRTNREIAHALGISERTVQAHLSHIFDKLDAASRTEAVTLALKHGLITLAP